MLGWLLLGLAAATVIVIALAYADEKTMKEALSEEVKDIFAATIKEVIFDKEKSKNVIKLDALTKDGEKEVVAEADEYNTEEIYEGKILIITDEI